MTLILDKNIMKTQKAPILSQILEANLDKVAIFGGAGVDPDGLASVEAMAAIIEKHPGFVKKWCLDHFFASWLDRKSERGYLRF